LGNFTFTMTLMPNAVMKFQIIARDPEKTARFYASVFNWTIDASNKMGYRELRSGSSKGIDGGVWPAPPDGHDMVQLFIEVEDIDAAIAAATKIGATLLVPKSTLPDGDTMAILVDPGGLSFGVMAGR